MSAEAKKLRGNIKHSVVFWCFNISGEKWDIDKTCSVAKSLGCQSVEICGPTEWPTLKEYGLTCAMAANGIPGAPFMKGLNNPRYQEEVIATTTKTIDDCHAAIMKKLQEIGYSGYVSHEFIPTRDPLVGLREAVEWCDV